MKKIAMSAGVLALAAAVAVAARQDAPKPSEPSKEHLWLQQLVGEWDTELEMMCEPGKPASKGRGSETTRAIGQLWVLAEVEAATPMGPFKGAMTLGFDPKKGKYVGVWVDSMFNHLWQYEGEVDASGKVLTLRAEGPNPQDPSAKMKFRETFEITGKDTRVFKSFIEHEGQWVNCFTASYTRKKK